MNSKKIIKLADCSKGVIIWNERSHKFHEFENWIDGFNYIGNQKFKNFHEVIKDGFPRKLHFDIDACFSDYSEYIYCKEENNLLNKIINDIIKSFELFFKQEINSTYMYVTESHKSDINNLKLSYHIIIDKYYVNTRHVSKQFAIFCMEQSELLNEIIDLQVYNRNSMLRLIHNTKCGEERYKIPCTHRFYGGFNAIIQKMLTNNVSYEEGRYKYTVTYINDECKPLKCDIKIYEPEIEPEVSCDIQQINIIAKKYIKGFKFRDIKGNILNYNRIYPTHCHICNRTHDNDNTLQIRVTDIIEILCRHDKTNSSIVLSNFYNCYVDEYCEKHVKHYTFECYDALCVKSGMGTGKTYQLMRLIEKYKKIIGIVHRRALCTELVNKCREYGVYIEDYRDFKGKIDLNKHGKILILVDSLNRIDVSSGAPDLLFIDEYNSVCDQFFSTYGSKKRGENTRILKWLLEYSKHCICLDANLNQDYINTLNIYRKNIKLINNTYQSNNQRIINIIDEKKTLDNYIFNSIDNHEKIVIYNIESVDNQLALYNRIQDEFPDIKIGIYNSQTDENIKNEDFKNVDVSWSKYDVLIISPTAGAGISYEITGHFTKAYCIFTGACNVETSRQLMGRCRSINDFYVHIKKSNEMDLSTNFNDIIDNLKYKYNVSEIDNVFNFEYGENGELIFDRNDFGFSIWINKIKYNNLSKNGFKARFIQQEKITGTKINIIKETINKIVITHDDRKKAKYEHSEKIANAKIRIEDVEKYDKGEQLDINVGAKIRLLREFDRDINDEIEVEWVNDNRNNIIKHRNLKLATKENYLEDLRKTNLARIDFANTTEDEIAMIRHVSTYNRHMICNELLKSCGFNGIFDDKTITWQELQENIKDITFDNQLTIEKINYEFATKKCLRKNKEHYDGNIQGYLKFINGKLKTVFGVSIISTKTIKHKRSNYKITHTINL